MKINSEELEQYIHSVLVGVHHGIIRENPDYFHLYGTIKLSIGLRFERKGKGGVNIKVVNAGIDQNNKEQVRIEFEVGDAQDWGRRVRREEAEIAALSRKSSES